MKIRLVALDIDDTLLGDNGQFPEINRRALLDCGKRGIHLLLNSGRAYEVICGFVKDLGIRCMISSVNGARVDEGVSGPTLIERVFDEPTASKVYDVLKASGVYFSAYTRGHTYMGNSSERFNYPRFKRHVAEFFESGGHTYETVDDEQRLLLEGLYKPYKFVAMGAKGDARFHEILRALSPLGLSVSSSRADNLEIMMPGVDKGFALSYVIKRLGIAAEETMAFGDNTNDLPMLMAAGVPVAMENGEASVKNAAKIIAPDHAKGGVGEVLYRYVLGE